MDVVLGALIGGGVSILTTVLTNGSTFLISKNTKNQERAERARVFQRETLLDLQVHMKDYIQKCVDGYTSDLHRYDITGEWDDGSTNEIDYKLLDLNSRTSLLIQRVSDDNLRSQLEDFKITASKYLSSKIQLGTEDFYTNITVPYENVQKNLGKVLRCSY